MDAETIEESGPGDGSFVALAPEAQPPLSYLVVRRSDRNEVIDLHAGDDVTLGRGTDATITIDDAKASRLHARIRREGDVLRLTDLGSRNGTHLNEVLVRNETRTLGSGDVIRIGNLTVVVAETPRAIQKEMPLPADMPEGVVVADPSMVKVFEWVRKVASAPTTVLITGETGVGKEVVAEQVHLQSPRAKQPFVRLNCGALPETLLESELFGHEKGAFTGADKRKLGYLERANGGTLFLDEIGELQATLQTKLLRVLESRRFMRVGGVEEIASDVRFLAATNRDLAEEVRTGAFREDLFFRLSAFTIEVPPLRERPIEISLLIELFVRTLSANMKKAAPPIRPEVIEVMQRYGWPGNIRELRNVVERALVLSGGAPLSLDHLPESVRTAKSHPSGAIKEQLASIEQRAIEEALAAENNNQTRAAKRLGISRRTLLYKLEKYHLKK